MKIRKSVPEFFFDLFNVTLMGLLSLLFVYPLLYVVFASFSEPAELIKHSGLLLYPLGFSISGYRMVFSTPHVVRGYLNTGFYVAAGVAVNMLMSCLGAYVLSRKQLYIRRPLTLGIVFTMYFSGGLIPFFLVVKGLGLYNSRLALVLPVAINTWNMIIIRTAFSQIPASLEEAARIDGANDFTVLFRVIIPVAKSTIAVMVLFYAVQHWNAWFNAMIFLRDRSKYPLQLFLREVLLSGSLNNVNTTALSDDLENVLTLNLIKYCTIIISTAPILCIYPFLQKYFAKGVLIGSVKE
ncbi:MAG: carbohydrate ABC transporter permease [Treponema sp.]|jgi:putative aldouronate transport system permease protein|nr:carbohydrate ABC transporter permease [Treponema sp.]